MFDFEYGEIWNCSRCVRWSLVWNDSREENVSNSDSNFSDSEENSGTNEDDESFDSHDSEAKVSFDSERFFVVVAKNVYLLYVTS